MAKQNRPEDYVIYQVEVSYAFVAVAAIVGVALAHEAYMLGKWIVKKVKNRKR